MQLIVTLPMQVIITLRFAQSGMKIAYTKAGLVLTFMSVANEKHRVWSDRYYDSCFLSWWRDGSRSRCPLRQFTAEAMVRSSREWQRIMLLDGGWGKRRRSRLGLQRRALSSPPRE